MRILVISAILIINTILQSTYFEYIQIIGVKPNTAIIIIVSFAIMRGSFEGALVGFFSGLIQDILFGPNIGTHALLGMYVGYFCGKVNKDFFSENYFLELALCAASVLGYECIIYVFFFLLRGKTDFLYFFNRIILPEVVYTSFISLFIYKIMYWINNKVEAHENLTRKFLG